MNSDRRLHARSAIEALRGGVPNRSAIRRLESASSLLVQDFQKQLRACREAFSDGRSAGGIIVSGAFGAGKSHQLGYLAELAREENWIVSLLPISKETPLFDPAKLFAAAVRAAVVPNANVDVMIEAMQRIRQSRIRYQDLELWTTEQVRNEGLSPWFAALLWLTLKEGVEAVTRAQIARFFGGAKLSLSDVRRCLREAGAARLFQLGPVRGPELAMQRFRFAPRLFVAAGFAGWCILLDEVELIGRYSPRQRGKSYGELARWLGTDENIGIPGLLTVAAITDDFSSEMFDQKKDDEKIPALLKELGLKEQASLAEQGMGRLKREDYRINPPAEPELRQALAQIRALYEDAYDWRPPDTEIAPQQASRFMREYVKSWITAWDIRRLYQETLVIRIDRLESDYTELSNLEESPTADEGDV